METPEARPREIEAMVANPRLAVTQSLPDLGLYDEDDAAVSLYFFELLKRDVNWSDPHHGGLFLNIIGALTKNHQKPTLALLHSIYRMLTEYPNLDERKSISTPEVIQCFSAISAETFPKEGLVVIDGPLVRNLPTVINFCKRLNISLDRLRLRCPKLFLATELLRTKGTVYETLFAEAVAELHEENFLVEDAFHSFDIPLNDRIALLFSPQNLDVIPSFQAGHVEVDEIPDLYIHLLMADLLPQMVQGGKMFLNMPSLVPDSLTGNNKSGVTFVPIFRQITREIAHAIAEVLRENGYRVDLKPPRFQVCAPRYRMDEACPTPESMRTKSMLDALDQMDIQTLHTQKGPLWFACYILVKNGFTDGEILEDTVREIFPNLTDDEWKGIFEKIVPWIHQADVVIKNLWRIG
ncbi:MAG: hypothetical protein AAB588_00600 [Patescibacteria group bacterium]